MGGGHGGCTLLTRPTLKVSVKMMVLLRLKKSASPFRRRPGRTGGTRCERVTIQGCIVMPDPWPEGIRRGLPEGAIFCREPGLQRGRRRAPFARSRERNTHSEMT